MASPAPTEALAILESVEETYYSRYYSTLLEMVEVGERGFRSAERLREALESSRDSENLQSIGVLGAELGRLLVTESSDGMHGCLFGRGGSIERQISVSMLLQAGRVLGLASGNRDQVADCVLAELMSIEAVLREGLRGSAGVWESVFALNRLAIWSDYAGRWLPEGVLDSRLGDMIETAQRFPPIDSWWPHLVEAARQEAVAVVADDEAMLSRLREELQRGWEVPPAVANAIEEGDLRYFDRKSGAVAMRAWAKRMCNDPPGAREAERAEPGGLFDDSSPPERLWAFEPLLCDEVEALRTVLWNDGALGRWVCAVGLMLSRTRSVAAWEGAKQEILHVVGSGAPGAGVGVAVNRFDVSLTGNVRCFVYGGSQMVKYCDDPSVVYPPIFPAGLWADR